MDSEIDVESLIPDLSLIPIFTAGGVASSKDEWLQSVDRSRLPLSYRGNTTKEQLCLEYVDNFRLQFEEAFPNRPPLFLTALNEAGVPKFVCTTVRPALLPAKALCDLHQCAAFVAKYIRYEPLADPTVPPVYVLSPASTVERRAGDAFDMAITLVSLLIGAGYDAMCAVGTAPAAVTLRDTAGLDSDWQPPTLPTPTTGYKRDAKLAIADGPGSASAAVSASGAGAGAATGGIAEDSPYAPPGPPRLESVFDEEMRARSAARAAAEAADADKYASDDEGEAGAERAVEWVAGGQRDAWSGVAPIEAEHDPLQGRRVHCWVVVRPGRRGVEELLHVEPSTGRVFKAPQAPFLHVDCTFNHKNVWVNMQEPAEGALPPAPPDNTPDPTSAGNLIADKDALARGLAGRQQPLDSDMGVPPLQYDITGKVILTASGAEDERKDAEDDGDAGDDDGGADDDADEEGKGAMDPIEAAKRRVLAILARAPTKPRAMESAVAATALLERLAQEDEAAAKARSGAAADPDASAATLEAMQAEAEADAAEAGVTLTKDGQANEDDEEDEEAQADREANAPAAPIGLVSFAVEEVDEWEHVFIEPDRDMDGIGGRDGDSDTETDKDGDAAAEAGVAGAGGAGGAASGASASADGSAGAAGAGAAAAASKGEHASADAVVAAAELELEEEGDHVLDLPASWVKPLRLPRYAVTEGMGLDAEDSAGQMEIRSRCVETRWAPRSHPRGMVCRTVRFSDAARLCEEVVNEAFSDREDHLQLRVRLPSEGVTEERFLPGREDGLRVLRETMGLQREAVYYPSARTDGLVRRLEVFGRKIMEWYDGDATPNGLHYRSVTFLGPLDAVKTAGLFPSDAAGALTSTEPKPVELMTTSVGLTMAATGGFFVIRKMAEKFARKPSLAAHRDIAKFKFLLLSREIEARYQTAKGRVVPNTRLYKSRQAGGMAAEAAAASGMAEGHLDVTMLTEDSFAPSSTAYERELDFRNAVLEQKACFDALKHSHKACTEAMLATREAEEAAPRLTEHPFAEAARRVREGAPLEDKEEADESGGVRRVDYLAPFLVDV
jgi:hypothetical protein